MLSKIVRSHETGKMELRQYVAPSAEEIDIIQENRNQETNRKNFLEQYKQDPLAAARKEANLILVSAQEKLKAAQQEAGTLKARQEKEIRTLMEKEFHAKLEAELAQIKKNSQDALAALNILKETIYKDSEKELMELVFSITRKVIGDEIKSSPQVVKTMLQKGFEKIKEARQYEVKLNPADYEALSQGKGGLNEIIKTPGTINFTKDDTVEQGGCKIITESGEISSEPAKQLDIIVKELSDET
ncbi:MAG: flagellar assembly protein FliH [Acidobacteriota bacterium]|nr:flagellar assembly protein FliH [Acidobacteriota bacterium]